jgi:type I site-specific restriction endonuclease
MSTNMKVNHVQQQAADQSLMNGLNKHAQSLSSFLVGSNSVKTSDIVAALQARIAAANTAQSTRATWQAAVQANANERASTKTLVSAVRQALQVMFTGSIDTLADFGLKPRKARTAPTPEQKVAAAAKAKATRAARHTMGTKQKKSVKGTVTTIVTPASSTAAPPAVAAAPSPVASGPAQGTTSTGGTPRTP